jgi:peptide/nickel transport system permease protein
MGRYIVRRLLWVVVLLFFVSLITFIIFFLLPTGDPAALRAGRSASPSVIASIRHQLGLDRSKPYQYWHYIQGILPFIDFHPHFKLGWHFDLGTSYFQSNAPVRQLIFDRLPATISLAFGAVIIWVVVGVTVGIISGVRSRSLLDRVTMGGALVAISAPVFWLGLVSLYLFSKDIGKIPIFDGANSYPNEGLFQFTPHFAVHLSNFGPWFGSLLLPWMVLAASFAAFYARLLRSNLIETMGEDYIRTARAKGLPERTVIMRHGVRSAITPVVTALGLDVGILLGGAILTESVFNIPGIGRLSYDSIIHSDLPTIQGTVLFGAFFIVVANLIVDVAYAFLDPRVRYS